MADFSDEEIQSVWNKGTKVKGYDVDEYRKDVAGAWMQRDKYGKQESFGWEIDHVYPDSKGGDSNLVNLRPMQWENNRSKSDNYPNYETSVTSSENKNIDSKGSYSVNEGLQKTLSKRFNLT